MIELRRGSLLILVVVLAMCCAAGAAFKTHCLVDGVWYDAIQYATGCYSDAVPFWGMRGGAAGKIPYFEARIEYPVLTGGLIWMEGLATNAIFGSDAISTHFVTIVVLANAIFAIIVLVLLKRFALPVPRLWAWAASPLLLVYIGHNWDLLAVVLTVGALIRARGNHLISAGVLAGLGASAKFYPALLVPLLCLQPLLARPDAALALRLRTAIAVAAAALGAWLAVNAPVAILAFENWFEFYRFSADRGATAASIWEILSTNGLLAISHEGRNRLATVLTVLGAVAIVALGWKRHARHVWIIFVPVLGWFVFINKVYSPQFDLWLYPLFLIAVRRPLPIVVFTLGSLLAFYSELWWFSFQEGGAFGVDRWAVQLSAFIRAAGLFWAMACVLFTPAPRWISGEPVAEDQSKNAGAGVFPSRFARKIEPLFARFRTGSVDGVRPRRAASDSSAPAPSVDRDPLVWCLVITAGFFALGGYGLLSPSSLYFDETHYIPAARSLLQLVPANQEHPLLAKEIFAAAIVVLGDGPLAWRLPSLAFGSLGLFAFGRLMWWLSGRRFATIAAMVLLATNFMWFFQSRIGMLDIFAAALLTMAFWQFAAALSPRAGNVRNRLFLTGLFLGLALGAKWSVLPFVPLPAIAFAVLAWRGEAAIPARGTGRAFLERIAARPLVEGGLWLIVLPLLVYWASFAPAFFYSPVDAALAPYDFVGQHLRMIASQASAIGSHPNQSVWLDWVWNRRSVWYLYEREDGAQRGVLLIGNPFTMRAALPAWLWCCWAGWKYRRRDATALAALYFLGLGFWIVAAKPVQFYYHYLLSGAFLMGCLALALDALKNSRMRFGTWAACVPLAASAVMFWWFYPILSAVPLYLGPGAFETWMWIDGWR